MPRHSSILFLALILTLPYQPALFAQSSWDMPSNSEISALLAERMDQNGVGIVIGVIDGGSKKVVSYGESGATDQRPQNRLIYAYYSERYMFRSIGFRRA